ncbi:helix-turn-helix transcriptional regulator [Streptomyces sp. NPDC021093]|uniref:helix-turn-helix transcriptional regulator n=1 Tax=Streptomyces sp. NPDC021093 TaxID=3365112 RepID=UPI0037B9AADD
MPESVPASINAPGGRNAAPAALELGPAGLLRAWRAAAGEKRGLGRPLTQKEVARGIGRSVRWYIELEGSATPRLERSVLDALARELMLDADQEASLHLHALGGAVTRAAPSLSAEKAALLQHLLDQQMPNPAYICDVNWDIIGYNAAMVEWYPWVLQSGANLMRWVLCSDEARKRFVNWEQDAIVHLEQLRYSLAEHPRNIQLQELLECVLQDSDCRRLWDANVNVRRSGDGHHFFQVLPPHGCEIVHLVRNILYPASLPHSRLVVINSLGNDDAAPESVDSESAVPLSTHLNKRSVLQARRVQATASCAAPK